MKEYSRKKWSNQGNLRCLPVAASWLVARMMFGGKASSIRCFILLDYECNYLTGWMETNQLTPNPNQSWPISVQQRQMASWLARVGWMAAGLWLAVWACRTPTWYYLLMIVIEVFVCSELIPILAAVRRLFLYLLLLLLIWASLLASIMLKVLPQNVDQPAPTFTASQT